MKIDWDELSTIEKTLFIPLAGRAIADCFFPKYAFRDLYSEFFFDQIPKAFKAPLLKDRISLQGSIIRTLAFDKALDRFLFQNPNANVVVVGAGLCSRSLRFSERYPNVHWIELDSERVLDLKSKLCGKKEKILTIPSWIGEDEFFKKIQKNLQPNPTCWIIEGVSMFLGSNLLKKFISDLHFQLSSSDEIIIDGIHPWAVRFSRIHPSLRYFSARLINGESNWIDFFKNYTPKLVLKSDSLLTERMPKALRIVDSFVRFLTKGTSLYEIYHLRYLDGGKENANCD